MLSIPSVSDLATFKGKSENFYTQFAEQALAQAALLLSIRTGLTAIPEDESEALLANYAIMDLANQIYLESPYDEILAKPFSSESIGSYSYSKSASAARKGEDSGSMWFELALERLGNVDGDFDVNSGSISMFERANVYQDAEGRSFVLGPDDIPNPDINSYFYINAEKRD
jgi:hypothetical protein